MSSLSLVKTETSMVDYLLDFLKSSIVFPYEIPETRDFEALSIFYKNYIYSKHSLNQKLDQRLKAMMTLNLITKDKSRDISRDVRGILMNDVKRDILYHDLTISEQFELALKIDHIEMFKTIFPLYIDQIMTQMKKREYQLLKKGKTLDSDTTSINLGSVYRKFIFSYIDLAIVNKRWQVLHFLMSEEARKIQTDLSNKEIKGLKIGIFENAYLQIKLLYGQYIDVLPMDVFSDILVKWFTNSELEELEDMIDLVNVLLIRDYPDTVINTIMIQLTSYSLQFLNEDETDKEIAMRYETWFTKFPKDKYPKTISTMHKLIDDIYSSSKS